MNYSYYAKINLAGFTPEYWDKFLFDKGYRLFKVKKGGWFDRELRMIVDYVEFEQESDILKFILEYGGRVYRRRPARDEE